MQWPKIPAIAAMMLESTLGFTKNQRSSYLAFAITAGAHQQGVKYAR